MYQGKSLIIIPSYNEAENIVEIINDVLILSFLDASSHLYKRVCPSVRP